MFPWPPYAYRATVQNGRFGAKIVIRFNLGMLAAAVTTCESVRMSPLPPLYHLIRLWISLTRYLHQAADPARHERFGTHVGDLLIRAAVYLGTIEGRPMTPTKLAAYIGIPRPTVLRRLQAMERRGLVDHRGRAWFTPSKLLIRRQCQDFGSIVKLVSAAHEKLRRK